MAIGMDVILLFTVLALILWLMMKKPPNFPPGPPKWPIVGNLYQLRLGGQRVNISRMRKKYGDIVGLFIGNNPLIIVCGVDAIREVCFRDDFSGRQGNIVLTQVNKGEKLGIVNIDGEVWKVQRRFTLQHLRDLGLGRMKVEATAHEEIQAMFEHIERDAGGIKNGLPDPVCFHDILDCVAINTLWHMIAGRRYEHTDPEFRKLVKSASVFFQGNDPEGGLFLAYPRLVKMLPFLTSTKKLTLAFAPLFRFIEDEMEFHKKSIDPESPRDFIDIYYNEIERQKDNPKSLFNEKQLREICAEMFIGGTDTTFNSLTFGLLYMIKFPEVQKKFQRVIDEHIGRDRLPSLKDRTEAPYLEATVCEILRLSAIAVSSVPHKPFTNKEYVTLRGYHIPENTRVLLGLHDLHHDPNVWRDPFSFTPERFLDDNGKLFRPNAFLPTSIGNRGCPGEGMARNNLFLIFTALFQRYNLSVPEGHPVPSDEPIGNFSLAVNRYQVKVSLRN
ncbi:methyl farnesoate epoxidase-like [Ischnura elegans]|uniref:methyl farnesoate epoxidase-like n=1 Tax=Ischnura elegans TaxID=197161 RepID=UPI001ED88A4F|nr:methyl farnesoate epoxidase-like [Ischnura elegans]XP_046394548.1 methyl farnesoate epoxidase-like [Ischnura elegans]XP_046394549.1 methyl farnesoate epoxidase-like [Ischnura elegans]